MDLFADMQEENRTMFALYPYRPFATRPALRHAHIASMPVDVAEAPDKFVVKATIPGVAADDIDVTVHDGVLTIKAESESASEQGDATYRLRERHHGSLLRRLNLPTAVDEEQVTAEFDNGVLTLDLPKAGELQPRRIAIGSAES